VSFTGSFADVRGRTRLIASARWLLLILSTLYAACAALLYAISGQGLITTPVQLTVIGLSFIAIFGYNIIYHFHYETILRLKYVDHFHILLDLLFVTILVYCSGSAASWLWPLYLLVTLEASILLEEQTDVQMLGIFGSLLYGALLLLDYFDILPPVQMPFSTANLNHQSIYLLLNWLWVGLLNTTVAIAGSALMKVIRQERRAVEKSEAEKTAFMESAHDLIFHCNPDGEFLYVNPAWENALGYSFAELTGKTMLDFITGDSKSRCTDEFRQALRGEYISNLEGRLLSRFGTHVMVEGSFSCTFSKGQPESMWGICRDITARKEAQEQLHHMAHHDMLTDLPNRLTFTDRLIQSKALAKRQKRLLALLFLDLDRFKVVNDTLGHAVGDMMLQEVANRLQSCVREADTVSRFGGDEFVILLVNPNSIADIERIALQILKKLGQPMTIDGNELFITTSIGISIFPDDESRADELIKKADIAMYQAKTNGRNNCQFYSTNMDEHAQRRLVLETGLHKALENKEFYLLYQPKVSLQDNRVTALEALLRWQHPELGLIPPTDFIALAEESGIIVPLGEWVLRQACQQFLRWQQEGLPPVRVAVNLSGFQLERSDFVERVKSILEETGVDGRFLEFEITETVIMQNPEFAVSILKQLRGMGIHISIDDFGTGYSSLAHLKRFSVNTLKIDKSFVSEVDLNSTDAAIATAIIAMGRSLNLSVIAEGVETKGQLDFLRKEKCHEMQGFLFSEPLPADKVTELLLEQKKLPFNHE
ncbi:MAG: EAL domain-containing protein, partial [Deltaproteobacteria bacterium]|nr:EAL domain-containing protein [Deltaproteobacteria bacterium]